MQLYIGMKTYSDRSKNWTAKSTILKDRTCNLAVHISLNPVGWKSRVSFCHQISLASRKDWLLPWLFNSFHGTAASRVQLKANCIAAKRCLRHYFKLIWETPTTEDTNFHRTTSVIWHNCFHSTRSNARVKILYSTTRVLLFEIFQKPNKIN